MSDEMRTTDLTCDDVREMAGSFVLGALDPAEEAAVRAHLATCDDAHAEIAEAGSVIPVLQASVFPAIDALGLEPSAALKGRIMAAAAADLHAPSAAPAAAPATAAPTLTPASAVQEPIPFPTEADRAGRAAAQAAPARQRTSPVAWVLRIAAVVGIVALVGWNLLLQNQLNGAEQYQRDVAAVLQLAAQDGSMTAVLRPAEASEAAGLAAMNPDGTLTLAVHDLDPTKGDQVYEAWLIGEDQVPVAIGGFEVGRDGTGFLATTGVKPAAGIQVVLTLEPAPGATAPAGPVVSSGAASAVA
jgi:anti-sigma factor RsiW